MTVAVTGDATVEDPQGHEPEPGSGPIYVMRAALALIRLPADQEAIFTSPEARALSTKVEERFRDALSKDPRVSEVHQTNDGFDVDNARTYSFYDLNPGEANLAGASVRFEALRLNSLLSFRVRVPAKNQPKYRSMNDVPADEYVVVWDGISLAVQWRQETWRATGSGGHVVFDVLADAGRIAGYPVEVLACNPGCRHKFMHADFVTFDDDKLPDHFHVGSETPVGSTVVSPHRLIPDDLANVTMTYGALHSALNQFAEVKTLTDYLSFLEDRARTDATEVLAIAYARAARRRLPHVVGMIKDLWNGRGARARTRQLIAGLWLALASIDAHLGTWRSRHRHLKELIEQGKLGELNEFFDPEASLIENLDLSLVRASLQETASRLEGRTLIVATFAGACAAVAGAAVVVLLT